MKWLSILFGVVLSASAFADDFKTTNGKEYKNVTVSRVEPDGIVVITDSGIVKLYFSELPKEVQERFHFDSAAAEKFAVNQAEQQRLLNLRNQQATSHAIAARNREFEQNTRADQVRKSVREAEKRLPEITVYAVIKPFSFERDQTKAWIQPYEQYDTGTKHSEGLNFVPTYAWQPKGDHFIAVIDEPMPKTFEQGDATVVALFKIGHTDDSSRHPLFTSKREKAIKWIMDGKVAE